MSYLEIASFKCLSLAEPVKIESKCAEYAGFFEASWSNESFKSLKFCVVGSETKILTIPPYYHNSEFTVFYGFPVCDYSLGKIHPSKKVTLPSYLLFASESAGRASKAIETFTLNYLVAEIDDHNDNGYVCPIVDIGFQVVKNARNYKYFVNSFSIVDKITDDLLEFAQEAKNYQFDVPKKLLLAEKAATKALEEEENYGY